MELKENKKIWILSSFHTGSTFINHEVSKYLNLTPINQWDLKNEKIENYVIKTHDLKNTQDYFNIADILIVPFRKKSKILQTGYLQNPNFNIETDINIKKYKNWLNNNINNPVYNNDYVLNIVNYFSLKLDFSKECYNIFNIDQKHIIIIDTQNSIPDKFFEEIYKIYYGKYIYKNTTISTYGQDIRISDTISTFKKKHPIIFKRLENELNEFIKIILNMNKEYDDIYYKIINNFKK